MTIRAAKFGDIPALAALMCEMHARSCYAGRAELDLKATKGLFFNAIQRHGGSVAGSTLANVAERDGTVEGFLIGVLDNCYHVLVELMATDLFTYVSERGDPRDAIRLLEAFMKWAKANPRVIEVRLGATNAIGDFERTAVLYKRIGLEQCGGLYQMALR